MEAKSVAAQAGWFRLLYEDGNRVRAVSLVPSGVGDQSLLSGVHPNYVVKGLTEGTNVFFTADADQVTINVPALPGAAMPCFHWNSGNNMLNNRFFVANGQGTSFDGAAKVISNPGIITRITGQCINAPGGVATRTFTLYKNGVASALSTTIVGAATTASSNTNVLFAIGDTLAVFHTSTGAAAASLCRATLEYQAQ